MNPVALSKEGKIDLTDVHAYPIIIMIHCGYLEHKQIVPADSKVPVQNPGFRSCGFITPTGGHWLSKPLNGLSSSIRVASSLSFPKDNILFLWPAFPSTSFRTQFVKTMCENT